MDDAKRRYISANRKIKKETGRQDELKAAGLETKYRRSLYNVLRQYDSISASVEIDRVYSYILNDKKSVCRYKDYVLKLCIKRKIRDYIDKGLLAPESDVVLDINIDEQLTATNGYYNLQDSIVEELRYGIINFNYGFMHPNLLHGGVKVNIRYCESKNNYMIQASDILANRIWTSHRKNDISLREIPNHIGLTFP